MRRTVRRICIFISGLKGLVGSGFMLVAFLWQGIEWTTIEYFNNAIICDLIEKVGSGQLFSVHTLELSFSYHFKNFVSFVYCSLWGLSISCIF